MVPAPAALSPGNLDTSASQTAEPPTPSVVRGSSDASQLAASDSAGQAVRLVAMTTAQEESEQRMAH